MQFTKEQRIILGIAGFILLFFLLVFLGVIPGLKKDIGGPSVKLEFWGSGDELKVWQDIMTRFESVYPSVRIKYTKVNEENYERQLLDALAAGQGPDIFMFHNTWLSKHANKIVPAGQDKIAFSTFRSFFPQVAEEDFVRNNQIYATPIFIDTLALFYNRDIFDNERIAIPPSTWEETKATALKIRKLNFAGDLSRAAIAIGGTSNSVDNAADILSLLMLQTGTEMVNPDNSRAIISNPQGLQALNFYTQFTNRTGFYYTWEDSFKTSVDSFAAKQVAMVLAYASQIPEIKAKNPALNYAVASAPQFSTEEAVNFANYWGLAVSAKSAFPDKAWDFALFATTNSDAALNYTASTGRPPALRFLINNYLDNPTIGIFAAQALTARSWPQPDNLEVKKIFDNMIESVISGKLSAEKALRQAEEELTSIMRP